jgi:hypothetical protein
MIIQNQDSHVSLKLFHKFLFTFIFEWWETSWAKRVIVLRWVKGSLREKSRNLADFVAPQGCVILP